MVHPTRMIVRGLLGLLMTWIAGPASGAQQVPLPYQGASLHVGVATCATSVCHGSVTANGAQNVRLDEFVTWSHRDKHAQAYTALTTEKARAIAAKLGIADARTDNTCLNCHSDNVPAPQRGRQFTLTDGVSCEACHGGAGPWLTTHTARNGTYRNDVARGMYPTADLPQRIALCLSCHMGNSDKFVTHRLMGAGHPRLSFELDTFLALQPPHYDVDADYAKRKPTYRRVQIWAFSQLALARQQIGLLQGPLVKQASFVPELALFDCHACHDNPMHRLDWNRGVLTHLTQPGALIFPQGHVEMAALIARRLSPNDADMLLRSAQQLQKSAGENHERVSMAAAALGQALDRVRAAAENHSWTEADVSHLLSDVVALGQSGEYRTYISAEQAVMAIDALALDLGIVAQYRADIDALYRVLRDDDAYDPSEFRRLLGELAHRIH